MTAEHDHDDDSLHAGCAGCIKAAEEEAWRVAPFHELTWQMEHHHPYYGRSPTDWFDLAFRVIEGAVEDTVTKRHISAAIDHYVENLNPWLTFRPADRDWVYRSARGRVVSIGPVIDPGPVVSEADTGCEQGALL